MRTKAVPLRRSEKILEAPRPTSSVRKWKTKESRRHDGGQLSRARFRVQPRGQRRRTVFGRQRRGRGEKGRPRRLWPKKGVSLLLGEKRSRRFQGPGNA